MQSFRQHLSHLGLVLLIVLVQLNPLKSEAIELMGLISYNISQVPSPHVRYLGKTNYMGYGFLGRFDLGPGRLETGFLYSTASITSREPSADVTVTGTYWMIPLLYRYAFFDPFFSVAAGFDYALVGSRSLTIGGVPVTGVTSGFRGHWGVQVGVSATQDMGENISFVLDLRYRLGLADAISFGSEGTRFNFWMMGVGIQKRFEP